VQIPYPATSLQHKILFVIDPGLRAVAADGEVNTTPHIGSRIHTRVWNKTAACFSYYRKIRLDFRYATTFATMVTSFAG